MRESVKVGDGASRKSSDDFSFGFLADDFGPRGASNWNCLFPRVATKNDYQSRFKESILGSASASTTRKSIGRVLCPWFNEEARRQEEFMKEMRVLSRLRHPCITTVMGAVVTHTHDPMLVMEYMEYGSLHDLLRNESMYLSGEIIAQITRDVSFSLGHCLLVLFRTAVSLFIPASQIAASPGPPVLAFSETPDSPWRPQGPEHPH